MKNYLSGTCCYGASRKTIASRTVSLAAAEDGGRMNKKVLLVTVLAVALLVGAYAWVKSSKNTTGDEPTQTESLGTDQGTANAPTDGAVEAQPNANAEGTPATEEPATEDSATDDEAGSDE